MSTIQPDLGFDPVSDELRAVLALFHGELAGVSFPDVDAAVLDRELATIMARAAEVARARDALALADAALAQRTAVLAQLAARGLAYARIYADAHPEQTALSRALEEVALARAGRGRAAAPRGRPPGARAQRAAVRSQAAAAGLDGGDGGDGDGGGGGDVGGGDGDLS
ncbi:MAG: hypothetical protein H6708_02525 [Kofleriaceae bacterium]|nr:hypothetical protein [Kofleriaceae bacterium]